MKAPDTIYLHGYDFDDEPCKSWEREPRVKGMRGFPAKHEAYIRKNALIEKLEDLLFELGEPISSQSLGECKTLQWVINYLNSL